MKPEDLYEVTTTYDSLLYAHIKAIAKQEVADTLARSNVCSLPTPTSSFFVLPLELRQQIYSYVFITPFRAFSQTYEGWSICPTPEQISYTIDGTALLAVCKRMRPEVLYVMYRESVFRLSGYESLRLWLNSSVAAYAPLSLVRRISLIDWKGYFDREPIYNEVKRTRPRLLDLLTGFPALRELEVNARFCCPKRGNRFERDAWRTLMGTLEANGGCLRIVEAEAATCPRWMAHLPSCILSHDEGETFLRMLTTSIAVRKWDDLLEIDPEALKWEAAFNEACRLNRNQGPLRAVKVDHAGRPLVVKIFSVPADLRDMRLQEAAWTEVLAKIDGLVELYDEALAEGCPPDTDFEMCRDEYHQDIGIMGRSLPDWRTINVMIKTLKIVWSRLPLAIKDRLSGQTAE